MVETVADVDVGYELARRADSVEPILVRRRLATVKRRLRRGRPFKRIFDIAIVLLTAPVVALALGVAALLIRLEDGGRPLFLQRRAGAGGKPFTIYKLRTMRDDVGGHAFTASDDARVTRIGRILRRYRIDELPQVWNVLRGEMSICGPRPEVVALSDAYRAAIPNYRLRFLVPPGITGWAQVHQGYAAGVDAVTEKLRYDVYYVERASVWMDLRILALTVTTLITGHGVR